MTTPLPHFLLQSLGQPSGWSLLIGLASSVLVVWQALKTKQVEKDGKDRGDALRILEGLVENLRGEVKTLRAELESEKINHREVMKQLNVQTMELASCRVEIGRLHLQKDQYLKAAQTLSKALKREQNTTAELKQQLDVALAAATRAPTADLQAEKP